MIALVAMHETVSSHHLATEALHKLVPDSSSFENFLNRAIGLKEDF